MKHPVSFFVSAVFKNMDRNKFTIYAYSDVENPDEVTEQISLQVDHFKAVKKLDDQSLLKQINDDQIDILFDLAGHTANNRLGMFHLRAAPIQISWLGYPATTGCQGIDYRLTDRFADPAKLSNAVHCEKLLRIEGGFLCYEPLQSAPEILASDNKGSIVFGCFNNLGKISEQTIELWAKILNRVSGSKLLIKRRELIDEYVKTQLLQRFSDYGIQAERLIFRTSQKRIEDHLSLYNQVDIALDTFPYNGTTTTFESLWMGTPVITRSGHTHASRGWTFHTASRRYG